jgi:hypothetical protein
MANGANLTVDVRVDESNLGWIHVIEPRKRTEYRVPALDVGYASGVSLWLHKVLKNRQNRREVPDQSPPGWLEAKTEIQEAIAAELKLQKRRTNKRRGRFEEALATARPERRVAAPGATRPQSAPIQSDRHIDDFGEFDNPDEDLPVFSAVQRKGSINERYQDNY